MGDGMSNVKSNDIFYNEKEDFICLAVYDKEVELNNPIFCYKTSFAAALSEDQCVNNQLLSLIHINDLIKIGEL